MTSRVRLQVMPNILWMSNVSVGTSGALCSFSTFSSPLQLGQPSAIVDSLRVPISSSQSNSNLTRRYRSESQQSPNLSSCTRYPFARLYRASTFTSTSALDTQTHNLSWISLPCCKVNSTNGTMLSPCNFVYRLDINQRGRFWRLICSTMSLSYCSTGPCESCATPSPPCPAAEALNTNYLVFLSSKGNTTYRVGEIFLDAASTFNVLLESTGLGTGLKPPIQYNSPSPRQTQT